MTRPIGGRGLASAKDTATAQIYAGIGYGDSRSVGDRSRNCSLAQEAQVGDDHLAGGAQNPRGAPAVAGAIAGFHREIPKRNKVKGILSLAVSGSGNKCGAKQRYVEAASNWRDSVASKDRAFDRAGWRQRKVQRERLVDGQRPVDSCAQSSGKIAGNNGERSRRYAIDLIEARAIGSCGANVSAGSKRYLGAENRTPGLAADGARNHSGVQRDLDRAEIGCSVRGRSGLWLRRAFQNLVVAGAAGNSHHGTQISRYLADGKETSRVRGANEEPESHNAGAGHGISALVHHMSLHGIRGIGNQGIQTQLNFDSIRNSVAIRVWVQRVGA